MTKNNETAQQILDFIIAYKSEHDGCSPSYREIAKACGGISNSVVSYHLTRLRSAGTIEFQDNTPRSIEVVGAIWLPPGAWKSNVGVSGGYEEYLRNRTQREYQEQFHGNFDAGADEQISTDREVA